MFKRNWKWDHLKTIKQYSKATVKKQLIESAGHCVLHCSKNVAMKILITLYCNFWLIGWTVSDTRLKVLEGQAGFGSCLLPNAEPAFRKTNEEVC